MKRTLAIAALMLLAACRTPSPEGAQVGVRVDDSSAPTARVMYDQVVILDKALQSMKAGKIAVESQGAHRTPTGTLRVVAQLRNRTDFPQVLEARTSFFDRGFLPTESASGWNRVHLDPNGIGTYQESSVGADNVAHYYVEVREAR
jgi:hypothetical protein